MHHIMHALVITFCTLLSTALSVDKQQSFAKRTNRLVLWRMYNTELQRFPMGEISYNRLEPTVDALIEFYPISRDEASVAEVALLADPAARFIITAYSESDAHDDAPASAVPLTTFGSIADLYRSSFTGRLEVTLGHRGHAASLAWMPSIPLDAARHGMDATRPTRFSITVDFSKPFPAPGPHYDAFKQRVAAERRERVAKDSGDNRSFIAKYWMYLLPIFLILMLSGGGGGNAPGGR